MKTMVIFKSNNFKSEVISNDSCERIETSPFFFRDKNDIKYDVLSRYTYNLDEYEYFVNIAGIQYYAETMEALVKEINNDGTIASVKNPYKF